MLTVLLRTTALIMTVVTSWKQRVPAPSIYSLAALYSVHGGNRFSNSPDFATTTSTNRSLCSGYWLLFLIFIASIAAVGSLLLVLHLSDGKSNGANFDDGLMRWNSGKFLTERSSSSSEYSYERCVKVCRNQMLYLYCGKSLICICAFNKSNFDDFSDENKLCFTLCPSSNDTNLEC